MQNDFSLINRRVEENGVTEASSPTNENVGFMAYNVLAGGVLTGKYLDVAAAVDNPRDPELAERLLNDPRGRMDDYSWGKTLYRYRSGPAGDATRQYGAIADAAGVSLTELALRWCRARDGVTSSLIGHTSMAQLDETLACFDANGVKGKPLPADVAWEIDRVHMRNRLPIFASDRVGRDWDGAGEIGERVP
jgi:aryl-alcohol dehydrogenase-like predicted oxidoreductase